MDKEGRTCRVARTPVGTDLPLTSCLRSFVVCFKFPFGLLLGEMAGQACAACVSSLRVPVPQARASTSGLLAAL